MPASETEGPGEADFSILRLKEVARQRELFSDMESEDSDSEGDSTTAVTESWKPEKEMRKRSASLDTIVSRKFEVRSNSTGSYFRDFIYDETFDFLSYKHELRRAKLLEW